ncbi:MAG: leucine-rich repeat domain-containing protein [Candidatus Aminicenantes bacterium]|nr:leucine-rich repeat domain-containing protein [Candidatus Aminicenantes bacterium]
MASIIEFIKNWLINEHHWLTNVGIIIGLIAAFCGFLHMLGKAAKWLYHLFNRESLHRRLKPFFNRHEISGAVDNYVPTQCQNVDPSSTAEPGRVHAFAVRQKLVPFFIQQVFREKREEKYYLILADSGMGKTTFMINLFLKYQRKRFKKYDMMLVPLGHPKADEKIAAVKDKTGTILLLDAFDEDIRAAKDYKIRMQEIIDKTSDFQAVIITSRTHFFPSDPDIPQETGLFKFGGNKGIQKFYRLYVSPFRKKEIKGYLRRRYPFYCWFKRRRARAIVDKSPDLMVRPMLLANIDDLLTRKEPYQYTCQVYEEMVQRWLQRERVEDKEELRKFSEAVAVDMYRRQQERGGLYIDRAEIRGFAEKHRIQLDELEMRSRSLLNRNAEGRYKFAHKSILEYLLSLELVQNSSFYRDFNFDNMEQTRRFYKEQRVIPFFSRLSKGGYSLGAKKLATISWSITDDIKKLDSDDLDNIASLDLSGNKIQDITALRELKNIQALDLSNNQITDITPLRDLKNLRVLDLSGNPISHTKEKKKLRRKIEARGGAFRI